MLHSLGLTAPSVRTSRKKKTQQLVPAPKNWAAYRSFNSLTELTPEELDELKVSDYVSERNNTHENVCSLYGLASSKSISPTHPNGQTSLRTNSARS